jgi:hypothetical protein
MTHLLQYQHRQTVINWLRRHPAPQRPAQSPTVAVDLARAFSLDAAKSARLVRVTEGYRLPAERNLLERAAGALDASGQGWALICLDAKRKIYALGRTRP